MLFRSRAALLDQAVEFIEQVTIDRHSNPAELAHAYNIVAPANWAAGWHDI